jgi:AcrR family transcriptional regulator
MLERGPIADPRAHALVQVIGDVYTVHMTHTSDRLLAAAVAAFDRDGEAGISMRTLAEAVGLSPMALYRHYRGKPELLAAIAADAFRHWEARVAAIRARSSRRFLEAWSEAYLDFAVAEPRRYEACFLITQPTARRIPGDFLAGRSPAGRRLIERIDAGLADGSLRGPDALTVALLLWGEAHGLVQLFRSGRFEGGAAGFRRQYRRCLRLLLDAFTVIPATGVVPRPHTPRRPRSRSSR